MPSDLTRLLTATGVAIGRANGNLSRSNVPTLLQTCNVTLNISASISVPETLDTLALEEAEPANPQLRSVLSMGRPTLTIAATYLSVPSLVPVPPT